LDVYCLPTLQIKSLHKSVPEAFLDCHLCVVHPENYVDDLAAAGDWVGVGFLVLLTELVDVGKSSPVV
jgi:hypothetical protein